jgi:hypothetical protein
MTITNRNWHHKFAFAKMQIGFMRITPHTHTHGRTGLNTRTHANIMIRRSGLASLYNTAACLANCGITGQDFVRDEEKHLLWYRASTIPPENMEEWYAYAKECEEFDFLSFGNYYPGYNWPNRPE